jgi:ABC-2 type transport system permease protein
MVTIVALLAGMTVYGSGIELTGLIGVGLVVNVASTLFGAGVLVPDEDAAGRPLMQVPIFVLLFLAPVYVPLSLLNGWIHTVASLQPDDRAAAPPGAASSPARRTRARSRSRAASGSWR